MYKTPSDLRGITEDLQRVEFKKAEIIPGNNNSAFGLSVTYEIETLRDIFELIIQNIDMSDYFQKDLIPNVVEQLPDTFNNYDPVHRRFMFPNNANFFNGRLEILCGDSVIIKKIKSKTKEMTLEEVERALGHGVKIVSNMEEK